MTIVVNSKFYWKILTTKTLKEIYILLCIQDVLECGIGYCK